MYTAEELAALGLPAARRRAGGRRGRPGRPRRVPLADARRPARRDRCSSTAAGSPTRPAGRAYAGWSSAAESPCGKSDSGVQQTGAAKVAHNGPLGHISPRRRTSRRLSCSPVCAQPSDASPPVVPSSRSSRACCSWDYRSPGFTSPVPARRFLRGSADLRPHVEGSRRGQGGPAARHPQAGGGPAAGDIDQAVRCGRRDLGRRLRGRGAHRADPDPGARWLVGLAGRRGGHRHRDHGAGLPGGHRPGLGRAGDRGGRADAVRRRAGARPRQGGGDRRRHRAGAAGGPDRAAPGGHLDDGRRCRGAGHRHPRGVGLDDEAALLLQAALREEHARRGHPPHGELQRLHRGAGARDRAGDPDVPRAADGLVRRRLQLPGRPVRDHLRGPPWWHRQAGPWRPCRQLGRQPVHHRHLDDRQLPDRRAVPRAQAGGGAPERLAALPCSGTGRSARSPSTAPRCGGSRGTATSTSTASSRRPRPSVRDRSPTTGSTTAACAAGSRP